LFWERITVLRREGRLELLRDLPHTSVVYMDSNDYFKLCWSFKSRLTHLAWKRDHDSDGWEEDADETDEWLRGNQLAWLLPEFPMLESLSICLDVNARIYHFDSEIDACSSSLNRLSITTRVLDWPQRVREVHPLLLQRGRDNSNNTVLNEEQVDLSSIKPCPSIKEFRGSIPLYTDTSVKYFLLKFPQQRSFNLNDRKLELNNNKGFSANGNYLLGQLSNSACYLSPDVMT
jgi:hypothetical protein